MSENPLFQECPSRTIGRCVCPRDRPVLKREHETVCVTANSCEEPDWFKLGPAALRNFKFSTVSPMAEGGSWDWIRS